MNRRRKTRMFSLVMLAGLLSGLNARASDYRYDYEDDPAPSMIKEVDDLQQLAMSLKVDFYPTLIFFNAEGKEISQRLVGITVLEFVFDEIEKRLVRAEKALRD